MQIIQIMLNFSLKKTHLFFFYIKAIPQLHAQQQYIIPYFGTKSFPMLVLDVEWLVWPFFQIFTFNGFIIFFNFNSWFRTWCCSVKQLTQEWMPSAGIFHIKVRRLWSYIIIHCILGADSIKRYHLTSIGNSIVEIRRSYDRLFSTMDFLYW